MRGAGFCAVAFALLACGRSPRATGDGCELPPSTVVHREGNAVLETWELPSSPVWLGASMPVASGFASFRSAMTDAGGDLERPEADPPRPTTDAERELWRREDANAALMYGEGGVVRRVRCLEAALFARQDARYSQLTRPTEFIAHVLRRGDRLQVYFGAGDATFPPRGVYGLDRVRGDVGAGWEYWAILHNHTVRSSRGRPALGVPAPSTSDVQLFRSLVTELGLREVWVTNGMYTGVVPAERLSKFHGRD